MDFSNYKFRASQCYPLTVGSIGVTDKQDSRINELIIERDTGVNANGNKVKWTDNKKAELEKLLYAKDNPELPKTMETELRKIYRSVKWNIEFLFTNKAIEKGLLQEEDGFTTYQQYLEKVKNIKYLLLNNKNRIDNDFFTGETDCNDHFYNYFKWGFDIKMSWNKETHPLHSDKIDPKYEWQDLVYMDLTGINKWKTVHICQNTHEHFLNNEKNKYYYSTGHAFSNDDSKKEKYIEACRKLEILHIVDYDMFVKNFPYHELVISRDEWHDNNWDLPLKDRVVEKTVEFDQCKIDFLKERVIYSRKYLNSL